MIHVNSIKSFDKDIREIKESIIDDISFFVKNGVTHYYRDVYDSTVGEYLEYYFSNFLGYYAKYINESSLLEISWDINADSFSDRKVLSKTLQESCSYTYALSNCLKHISDTIIAALFNDFNSTVLSFYHMKDFNLKRLIKDEVYKILESYGIKIVIGKEEEDLVNISWEDSELIEKYKDDVRCRAAGVLRKAKYDVKNGYDGSYTYVYDTKIAIGVAALLRYAYGYKENMNINVYTTGIDHEVDLEIELLFDIKDRPTDLPQVKYHFSKINSEYCSAELHYLYGNLKLLDKSIMHSCLNNSDNFTYTCSMDCVPLEIRGHVHYDTIETLRDCGFQVSDSIYGTSYRYKVTWDMSKE